MPLLNNATVSTYAGATAKLSCVAVHICPPTAKDQANFGGIVRHVVLLDPAYNGVPADIQPGDDLQIMTWPPFAVPTKRFRVIEAPPQGNGRLATYRAVIAEKTQR